MTIEMSKNLGGVGALLMVISPFLGSITALLGLIGLILVLIAIKRLSDHYNDGSIFNNALYGVIANIIGGIVFAAAIVVTAVGFLSDLGLELSTVWSDPAVLSAINWQAVNLDILGLHFAAIMGSLVALFVFVVVAAIFYRKALTALSEKTGVGLFGTTGLLMLIGAVLTVIGIGLILLWISLILLAAAFFSIKTQST